MDYLVDDRFEGILTAIYWSYYREKADGIYPVKQYQFSLTTQSQEVVTDPVLADKVYDGIAHKISTEALRRVYYVYLSNHPLKENLILRYLQLGFRMGQQIENLHTHPDVHPVLTLARKVSHEAHRFKGLLRFAQAPQYLYAAFEPDHHILTLLVEHFTDRLAQENFIIHDKRRELALIYNRQDWVITDFPKELEIKFTETEAYYQELWSRYFLHIGIENRKNTKQQAQFVPHRYRKHLIEFRPSLDPLP